MRAPWLDGVAAGALLVLSAALSALPAPATAEQSIEARIPVPEPANVPPPTISDLNPSAQPVSSPKTAASVSPASAVATAAPAVPDEAAIIRGVPVPEPANVPPPTIKDIGSVPLAPADLAVAEKLREFVTSGADRFFDAKKDRAAAEEFYKARAFAPIWIEYGKPTPRMPAAIARLKAADADGLDANDYATPDLKILTGDPDSLAQAELKLLNSLLTFARQAQSGRVTASRISTNIEVTQPVPEPAAVLKTLAGAKDIAAAMDAFNPPHEGFRMLKAKLAELRGAPEDRTVQIPDGPPLRPATKKRREANDARVPLLRQRLKIEGDVNDTTYDADVVEAVKAFQKSKGIKQNGILSPETTAALNGRSRSRDINAVISNMERWRWLPRNLGQAYVMVNVPDFTLKVVNDSRTIFHTRIVVGKATTPSPIFSDEIENIQVNPTWHVPQSIIYGEYLPALQQDPSVLARMGLVMERNRDGSISVRQPPGERNALGRIKFNFPNRFQVYLHDTPQKHLFAHERRAYSHGCMRVQNPDRFGEILASIALPREGYTAERFTRMYGSGEHWIKFKRFVPVHLVYMNAYVDEAGKLVVRDDVYGYDGRVQSALNGKYVVVAERSQRVTAGQAQAQGQARAQARRNAQNRRVVEQQPQGWFLFPFFR